MKAGYIGEIMARKEEFTQINGTLESLYMTGSSKDEKVIQEDGELLGQFTAAIKKVDEIGVSYASTLKSVKLAIEAWNCFGLPVSLGQCFC